MHTRARGYLLTLKCLRVSFRDAVRHEAEGRAACSKMVSEKNIGRMRLGGHSTTRSSTYGLRYDYKYYQYQQHKDEISAARRHTKQVYCSWHNSSMNRSIRSPLCTLASCGRSNSHQEQWMRRQE